jgi:protein TonB
MMASVSFGVRAVLASAFVHGTIVAVVATTVHVSQPVPVPDVLVDVQREAALVPPPPAQPIRPFSTPQAGAPGPVEIAPPALAPHLDRTPTSSPPQHSVRTLTKTPDPVQATEAPTVVQAPGLAPASGGPPGSAGPTFTMTMAATFGSAGSSRASTGETESKREAEVLDLRGEHALADRTSGPAPAYPRDAQEDRLEGDVPLEILVDTTGRVLEVKALRTAGHGFDESALSAVRKWTFKPQKRDGHPVAVRLQWTVQFRLD